MTRRQVLGSAAALLQQRRRIIDAHTHFYDPSRPGGVPWPGAKDAVLYKPTLPDRFQKLTAPLGVVGTVVVEASPLVEDNQWILDLAKDNPIIVGFIGHLYPGTPEFAGHLQRFAKNPLFRGIRLGRLKPEFSDDLKRLAAADLTLDSIGGPQGLEEVARLNDALPALRIVVHHLPYATGDLSIFRGRKNVFAKVSDAYKYGDERLDEIWTNFGADRVIYASNWPVSDKVAAYQPTLERVERYFATREPDKYFFKNSQTAYQWISRGAM